MSCAPVWAFSKETLKSFPKRPDCVQGFFHMAPRQAGVKGRLERTMDESAYIMEAIAGVVFLVVGVRLYALSRRTGGPTGVQR